MAVASSKHRPPRLYVDDSLEQHNNLFLDDLDDSRWPTTHRNPYVLPNQ
jgi:hypothetical protein